MRLFKKALDIFVWIFSKIIISPLRLVYRFFLRKIIFYIYKLYLAFRKPIYKIFAPAKNKILIPFHSKSLVHITIVFLAIIIMADSIQAKGNSEIGKKSMIFIYLNENVEIEEFASNRLPEQTQQLLSQTSGVSTLPSLEPVQFQTPEGTPAITQGGAVVKPEILATDTAQTERKKIEIYTVQTGDTVSSIAATFGVTTNTLLWENNLSYQSVIKLGQKLRILPVTGVSHKVQKGDTIKGISEKYDAQEEDVLSFNNLFSSDDLIAGDTLIIPRGRKPAPSLTAPESKVAKIKKVLVPPRSTERSDSVLLWPTPGRVITQYFNWRHTGLDIDGDFTSPIFAAEAGKITRSGWGTGYGLHIVIDHGNGMQTRYAHCSELYVNVGQEVSRGETICRMGSTGWSTGSHLHFEVVINGTRKNPLLYTK